jgi:hypothetical protein
MKWLKRGLWTAAWGVWVWCGFGLARELPRDLGPVISQLPLRGDERVFGFLGDSEQIALSPKSGDPEFQTYDARTGEKIRDFSFPGYWRVSASPEIRTHGVVHGTGDANDSNKALHLVDLRTGVTTTLSDKKVFNVAFHPKRTWIAFRESAPAKDEPRSLVVVDWTTGAELFLRPPSPDRLLVRKPAFLGDSNRLAVPTAPVPPGYQGQRSTDLEIWRIETPCVLEKVVRLPSVGELMPSNSERIALRNSARKDGRVEVFALDSGRRLFSAPVADIYDRSFLRHSSLSPNARSMLLGDPASLWNVDDGSIRWTSDEWTKFYRELPADAFSVWESWNHPWTHGLLANWNTVAVRDLDDGRLRFRCRARDASALPFRSSDGSLGMTRDGAVHHRPFSVNFRVLALCQTILALPLILLWAVLRWRRSRRAGLVSASS